jgi:hypothetical protein
LFGWNLQPLAPPDSLDPFVIDDSAGSRSRQFRDLAVAVAAILTPEFDDVGGQPFLVLSPRRNAALRQTILSEHAPNPALGHIQLGSSLADAGAGTRGA